MTRVLTERYDSTYTVRGVAFPDRLRFRRVIVVGPPGTGKSTLLTQVGGWPEEAYLDLTADRWWASKVLAIRPRQVHLGLPFAGFAGGLPVYDPVLERDGRLPALDFTRLPLPAPPRFFFSMNWRLKYAFEFLLPPAAVTYAQRSARARTGSHAIDADLTLTAVEAQTRVFWELAAFLWQHGFYAYIRRASDAGPERIVGVDDATG